MSLASKPAQMARQGASRRGWHDGTLLHEERSVWKAALVVVVVVLFIILTNVLGAMPH